MENVSSVKTLPEKLLDGSKILFGFLGVVMILVETYAVFGREILKVPVPWADEMLKLLFVWCIFVVCRRPGHLRAAGGAIVHHCRHAAVHRRGYHRAEIPPVGVEQRHPDRHGADCGRERWKADRLRKILQELTRGKVGGRRLNPPSLNSRAAIPAARLSRKPGGSSPNLS